VYKPSIGEFGSLFVEAPAKFLRDAVRFSVLEIPAMAFGPALGARVRDRAP